MKKILSLSLLLWMLCSCTEKNVDKSPAALRLEKEKHAVGLSEKILNSFLQGRKGDAVPGYVFPDYYGGCYIGKDGVLVVLVKGDKTRAIADLNSRVGSDGYAVKECMYSLNELTSLKNELDVFFAENRYPELKWNSIGIDISHNRVCVMFEVCSEKVINEFKQKICDSPMLMFEQMERITF